MTRLLRLSELVFVNSLVLLNLDDKEHIVVMIYATETQATTIRGPAMRNRRKGAAACVGVHFLSIHVPTMHTADLLEEALKVAKSLGFSIRHEWLDGSGGGGCEIHGQRWIFVDLALGTAEQLAQVTEAISQDAQTATLPIQPELRNQLKLRKSA